jgi:predicted nucleotidyltransferase
MSEKDRIISILRRALPELRQRWPIRKLAVFGSVAREDAEPGSDLDILIEFDAPVTLSVFLALEEALSELTGRPVDLVFRSALKPFIGRHVFDEAIPV